MESQELYKCCRCKEALPRDSFGGITKRNDYCKICKRQREKDYRQLNSEKIRLCNNTAAKRRYLKNAELLCKYLNDHPCIICGESDLIVLDFDHRDRSTKKHAISDLIHVWAWENILTEIEKCDILCANCHRRKTAKEFGWYKVARLD